MLDRIIEYFQKYIEVSSNNSELDKINARIEKLREYKSDIDKLINSRPYEKKVAEYWAASLVERLMKIKSLTYSDSEYSRIEFYISVFLWNNDNNNYYYTEAKNCIMNIQKDCSYALSKLHKQANSIANVADTNTVALLKRIIKPIETNKKPTDEIKYKISGNLTVEELEIIENLLRNPNPSLNIKLEIDDKLEFIQLLNDEIAKFKFNAEKIKIEEEKIKAGIAKDNKVVETSNNTPIKKVADYDYSRINEVKKNLMKDFQPSSTTITSDTPYELKTRIKSYYFPNLDEYNYASILYDLNTFINPDKLDEMFQMGKIDKGQLNEIRNRIYPKIINIVKDYIRKKENNTETKEVDFDKEEIEIKEDPKIIPEVPNEEDIEEIELETSIPNATPDIVVDALTEKEIEKINYVKEQAKQYIIDFYKTYNYPPSIIEACLEAKNTTGYNFSLTMAELIIKSIPDMESKYDEYYNIYYEYFRQNPNDDDARELFINAKDSLLASSSKVLNDIETMPLIEEKEDENIILRDDKNFIMIYQDSDNNFSIMQQDVKESLKDGKVSAAQIYKGFDCFKALNTITCQKVKTTDKNIIDRYSPHKYKHNDIRYTFTDISIHKENRKFLMEYYNETDENIQLKLIYSVFYKKDDGYGYAISTKRLNQISGSNNQPYSVDWIKTIFGSPFTDETRDIAIKLLDNSANFIESIKTMAEKKNYEDVKGEMTNGPKLR